MRSRTGCLTCRQRKLKCSEEKPACAQCVKASRECIPSSGITFRHQHNASLNGSVADSGDQASLGKYYSYKNTFDDDSVWLDVPRHVTFIHTTNPYEDPPTPGLEHLVPTPPQSSSSHEPSSRTNWNIEDGPNGGNAESNIHTLDGGSSGVNGARVETDSPVVQPGQQFQTHMLGDEHHQPSIQSPGSIRSGTNDLGFAPQGQLLNNNLDFILNHPSSISPPVDPALQPSRHSTSSFVPRKQSHRGSTSSYSGFKHPQTNQEIAYLLRYFSEGPGLWMDLFDLGLYFSYYVPVKALIHPLLKFSAVALAAKALGRIKGDKPIYGGKKSRLARSETYAGAQETDWDTKSREYYDTAISILRQRLLDDSSATGNDGDEDSENGAEPSVQKRRRLNDMAISCPHSVELLVATAILGVYEFLDASNPDWSRHLNGAKSLLEIAKDGMMPFEHAANGFSYYHQSPLLKARKATFWNIARQDMLAAFINDTHTRINTEDLDLWREAGLLVDTNGFILPSTDTDSITGMREDLVSNALIWLMMKLVNFMAAGDDLPIEIGGGPWAGVPQRTLLEYWHHLNAQFQRWFDVLPKTFNPVARIEPALPSSISPSPPGGANTSHNDLQQPHHNGFPAESSSPDPAAAFPELWFSIPMCAATLQHYHFSQILLLLNKPHESTQSGRTTLAARLSSYHALVAQSRQHAREIVAISLSNPEASIRVHAVQPLFTAGQCLEDEAERGLVLRLLRECELDTGWATEYRVQQLLGLWGVEGGRMDVE